MGLLSSSISLTQYKVQGQLDDPVMETVRKGLQRNAISDIDNDPDAIVSGWTSFKHPFAPDFSGSDLMIGTDFLFSLRIDKKTIPSKVLKKHYLLEMNKQLEKTGREFLSKNEKRDIKDHVVQVLSLRIPATPNIYDIVWRYEEGLLWCFTNLKAANEELETLFNRSFKLGLIRLFPFTTCELTCGLSDVERDSVSTLRPTQWMAYSND
ncbi:MAG: recombination-associated protein RdgC [Desulfobacterales bacterium]|jgi:DNA recombination-dependent growth factor C